MKNIDFICTVGYQGDSALIDKKLKSEWASLSSDDLIQRGALKAAFCKAVADDNLAAQQKVLEFYNHKSGSCYESIDQMKRLFGVFQLPSKEEKIVSL